MRYNASALLVLWAVSLLSVSPACAEDAKKPAEPEPRTFAPEGDTGAKLLYRFLAPPSTESGTGQKYPLLLCLHGAGERGADNARQVGHFRPLFTGTAREQYPCFVVLPQVPDNEIWATYGWSTKAEKMAETPSATMKLTKRLVDQLVKDLPIDADRIYVTGLSMGGYGTWEFVQRWPDLVAAAAPVCGGGDPAQAGKIKDVPLWAFHGDKDGVIRPEMTGRMIEALKAAGGQPKYTLFPGVGHGSWGPAYSDPELLKWMFAQRKSERKTLSH